MSDSITSASNHLSLQQLTGSGIQVQQTTLSTTNTGSSGVEQGHSRNSSNTSQVSAIVRCVATNANAYHLLQFKLISIKCSCPISRLQMSKGSGYSSFSQSQHSRQSSEGDSGHTR